MSSVQDSSAEQVLRAVQALRMLTQELRALAHATEDQAVFFEGMLRRLSEHLGATAGAVWTRSSDSTWQLQHAHQLEQCLPDDDELVSHRDLLAGWDVSAGIGVVPPYQMQGATGGDPFVLILAPLSSGPGGSWLIEFYFPPDRPPEAFQSIARFLQEITPIAAEFLSRQVLAGMATRQETVGGLQIFVRHVHDSLDLQATSYAIVNEGRRLIGCDCLSLVVVRGNRYQVEAISGQDLFDRRSDAVRALSRLASVMGRVREPLWYTGDSSLLPPQIQEAVRDFTDISECRSLAVLPLQPPVAEDEDKTADRAAAPLVGVLVVEQFTKPQLSEATRQQLAVVSEQATLALRNALEHRALFLMPLWKWLGGSAVVRRSRRWPRWAWVGVVSVFLLGLLALIPAELALEGRATLEPIVRQDVFSATAGVVQEVHVRHGERVEVGTPLLHLRNVDLEVELARLQGEISSSAERWAAVRTSLLNRQQLADAERTRLAGEEAQLRQKLASLRLQSELFELRLAQLEVVSPIAGQVISWDVQNVLMNRPIQPGQLLMTVAQTDSDWELLVRMPENRMGHVLAAWQASRGEPLDVTFMLASEPGSTCTGSLIEVHGRAEEDSEKGGTVLLRVKFDKSQVSQPRPGATATVKVHCGRRSLGYVWFHDVWEFVESRILF